MHKLIDVGNILTSVTNESDCDVIIAEGAWGGNFMNHYLDNIQRNHKLCLERMKERYEYVFYTTPQDYEKYKDKFTIPDITFLIGGGQGRLMTGIHMDYAYSRGKPLISMASDCLQTPNLIPNLLNKYSNHDVCGVMVQRVCHEILADIITREEQIPYETIFSPREFLKLCFPNLYPLEKCYFMDNYSAACNGGYWTVRRGDVLIGELIRAFHIGIVYIKNPIPGLHGWGLDSNPFLGNLTTPETIGMVTDSDDGFIVDVSTAVGAINIPDTPARTEPLEILFKTYWRNTRGNGIAPINESLMGFSIAIHSEPLDQEWLDLANIANDFVTRAYDGEIINREIDWGGFD